MAGFSSPISPPLPSIEIPGIAWWKLENENHYRYPVFRLSFHLRVHLCIERYRTLVPTQPIQQHNDDGYIYIHIHNCL